MPRSLDRTDTIGMEPVKPISPSEILSGQLPGFRTSILHYNPSASHVVVPHSDAVSRHSTTRKTSDAQYGEDAEGQQEPLAS
ncbi:hypothetical protein HDU67_001077 [Dinochytrium kinnereticum]|nr:hypothetical protein HDU67_001077 [Dinochytrium kinnereticum]